MTPGAIRGTVVITGASGFIGGRLRERLLRMGADVLAIRRAKSREPTEGRSAVVEYSDLAALTDLMAAEKPAYVFHVAGATKGVSYEDFRLANVMPTENLLAALARAKVRPERFVHVSSLASYGPASSPQTPMVETMKRDPVEHYGRSKLEAEKAVEQNGAVRYTIIRPGGVYGPGDVDYFELFKQVERGVTVYFGNRERWFSAVYVDDVIDAIVRAATRDEAADKGYFICDGRPVTWQQFQSKLIELSGKKKVREIDLPGFLVPLAALGGELLTTFDKKPRVMNRQKAIMGKQKAWICTHDAARRDFGYAPAFDLEAGIRQTFEWYRREGWL
jgi:nucleoside-diphosphate-sugar epimerase